MSKKPTYAERKKDYKIVTVMLHRERDADLVHWVDNLGHGKTNEAIRQACYAALEDSPAGGDPDIFRRVLDESLAGHLVNVRRVLDSALAGFTPARPQLATKPEAAGLLAALDKSLDLD